MRCGYLCWKGFGIGIETMEFKTSDVYNSEQMTENCAIKMVDRAISELQAIKNMVVDKDIDIVDIVLTKHLFMDDFYLSSKHIVLYIEFENLFKERI